MANLIKRFLAAGDAFRDDHNGVVAVLFALCLIPIFGLVGAAIDYNRASGVKAQTQAALDAAALAAAKAARNLSEADLNALAQRVFNGNMLSGSDTRHSLIRARKVGKKVLLEIDASVQTSVTAAIGFNQFDMIVRSEASWDVPRVEIVLVLDNTGSMGWLGKMDALKAATRELIDTLEAARVFPDQIKVAIVPFDTQVNVGVAARNEPWIRFDTTGLPAELHTTQADWAGCLTDRDMPHDTDDAAPTTTASRYRAARCGTGSLAALRPLTNNFPALRATVNAMQPSGYTNITIGVQMGLATISPSLPFSEAQGAPGPDLLRFMVLLTDGDNTKSRYVAPYANIAAIDARTELACREVKRHQIKVFTVRVIEGNENLLRGCASDPSMYFNVTNAGGIRDAFRAITRSITSLRLTS